MLIMLSAGAPLTRLRNVWTHQTAGDRSCRTLFLKLGENFECFIGGSCVFLSELETKQLLAALEFVSYLLMIPSNLSQTITQMSNTVKVTSLFFKVFNDIFLYL